MYVFSTCAAIAMFSRPQSPPFFFSHLSEHFFSPLYHIFSLELLWSDWELHLWANAGFPMPSRAAWLQHRAQPQSTMPEAKTPCAARDLGVFFFHWCNHNWNQKRKNPLTSPQGPCLILYSLWICVQDFFYYLPACDSLVVAGRWQRHHIADVSFKKLAPLLADRAHVKISYIHHCHLCALCWKLL